MKSPNLEISETCTHLHLHQRSVTYFSFTKVGIFLEILPHPAVSFYHERNASLLVNFRLVSLSRCLLDRNSYLGCLGSRQGNPAFLLLGNWKCSKESMKGGGGGGAAPQWSLVSWVVHFPDNYPTDCPAVDWAMEVENGAVLEHICQAQGSPKARQEYLMQRRRQGKKVK